MERSQYCENSEIGIGHLFAKVVYRPPNVRFFESNFGGRYIIFFGAKTNFFTGRFYDIIQLMKQAGIVLRFLNDFKKAKEWIIS